MSEGSKDERGEARWSKEETERARRCLRDCTTSDGCLNLKKQLLKASPRSSKLLGPSGLLCTNVRDNRASKHFGKLVDKLAG